MTFFQSCWLLVLQLCMELKPNVRVHCMVQSATLKSKPQNESIISFMTNVCQATLTEHKESLHFTAFCCRQKSQNHLTHSVLQALPEVLQFHLESGFADSWQHRLLKGPQTKSPQMRKCKAEDASTRTN